MSGVKTAKTKIGIVLRADLATWQKLNVTAFLASGLGSEAPVIGQPYRDASDVRYLPMFDQPVLVYGGDAEGIRRAHRRALDRGLLVSVYTQDLFGTGNDEDNRQAVRAVATDQLDLVGIMVHGPRNGVDRALSGLVLHP